MERNPYSHFTIKIANPQPKTFQHITPPKEIGENKLLALFRQQNVKKHGSFQGQIQPLQQMHTATTIGQGRSCDFNSQASHQWTSLQLDSKSTLSLSHSQQPEHLKKSLIDVLNDLDLDIRQEIPQKNVNRTQLYECLEAHSIHQSDEQDESDRMSEVIQMTEEEHKHFHTFMSPIEDDFKYDIEQDHKKKSKHQQPAHKKKVIKNFFRPKDSLINDAKTCCNSEIWNQMRAKEVTTRLKTTVEESNRQENF